MVLPAPSTRIDLPLVNRKPPQSPRNGSASVHLVNLFRAGYQSRIRVFEGLCSDKLPYRTVELDNGAMLTADAASFDKVFEHTPVDEGADRIRFTTVGSVVSEKLEKGR